MKNAFLLCALLGLTSLLGACTTVQPWERDVTARHSMQLVTNASFLAANEHMYFSKEASSGGRSFDGGGCGCN